VLCGEELPCRGGEACDILGELCIIGGVACVIWAAVAPVAWVDALDICGDKSAP
jgi:hypothetical protein